MRPSLSREAVLAAPEEDQLLEVPSHVGIVMDGNRRWAKMRGRGAHYGHLKGATNVESIVEAAADLGIKALTLYAFSTENWRRSEEEIASLMYIFTLYLKRLRKPLIQKGVRLNVIGDIDSLPKEVKKEIEITKEATKKGSRIELILAISYGGRDDIRRSCIKACQKLIDEGRSLVDLTEEMISQNVDTSFIEDPTLIIRTGGVYRMSNFLLWQSSYSELYVTEDLWPDFDKERLRIALKEYQNREKNWGK